MESMSYFYVIVNNGGYQTASGKIPLRVQPREGELVAIYGVTFKVEAIIHSTNGVTLRLVDL